MDGLPQLFLCTSLKTLSVALDPYYPRASTLASGSFSRAAIASWRAVNAASISAVVQLLHLSHRTMGAGLGVCASYEKAAPLLARA